MAASDVAARIERLNRIGVSLSAENDTRRVLQMVLDGTRELTGADGATLYLLEADGRHLRFDMMVTESLGVAAGAPGQPPVPDNIPPVALYDERGEPDRHTVVGCAALDRATLHVEDAYSDSRFDFSGTRAFDQRTGYRSRSLLAVPMLDHAGRLMGVLQVLNRLSGAGKPEPFDATDISLAESLASQGAVSLSQRRLADEQRELFESLVRLIAYGIDEKSPETGAHCRRVPVATMLIAEYASRSQWPEFADFQMTDQDLYELEMAAWLHDCGKITTPVHVEQKATRLQTVWDRIELIEARMEILLRDARIRALAAKAGEDPQTAGEDDPEVRQLREWLRSQRDFLQRCNRGGEGGDPGVSERLREIAGAQWQDMDGSGQALISEDELYSLDIGRGTLNPEERKIIQDHIVTTIKMLEQLPFPDHLKRIPEYAGGHHEWVNGKGYPNQLTRSQMSIPARIMAVADVFEALTAPERSYKAPMPLSKTLTIMGEMVERGHLDPDLFRLFVHEEIYMDYARKHLAEAQIDEVDKQRLPGLQVKSVPA